MVTPRLTRSFGVLNKIFNKLAYEPPGEGDSYLFWASWGAHAGTSMFTAQDAHGPIRRGMVLVNCPTYAVLRGIIASSPRLGMLTRLLNPVSERQECPQNPVPARPDRRSGTPVIKQPPSFGRIFAMVAFALSCFGILDVPLAQLRWLRAAPAGGI